MKIKYMERNVFFNGIVVGAAAVLRPTIRIAPFTNDFLIQKRDIDTSVANTYLTNRFGEYQIFSKGKKAISAVLNYYNLCDKDVVTILTTSDNYYISGCVTREIEKFCKWNRMVCKKTKVIFINHEFGFPKQGIEQIAKYGIPIIEDCAHTFFDECAEIGKYSDFVIYSLPKAFPLQIGAVVKSNKRIPSDIDNELQLNILSSLSQCLCLCGIDEIKEKRKSNCKYYLQRLSDLGVRYYFEDINAIPGVFLFRWEKNMNYQSLKDFLQENGVECSVFYGEPAFYIPCHQNLSFSEMEYIIELIRYWYSNNIML